MAIIPAQRLLKQFVDRVREVAEFQNMLKGSGVCVMCIQGSGGMGKSLLLGRMMEECAAHGVKWVYVEWEDSRKYNYLDTMRSIRDQTGKNVLFQLFNDQVNSYMVPEYTLRIQLEAGTIENVHILEGGEIQQSNVTVHVGHTFEIKDLNVSVPRRDRDLTKIDFKLTEAFMPCLRAVTAEFPLIVFLDALEKADGPTLTWIGKEFLTRARDQEVNNLFVVLASRQRFELDPSFFDCSAVYDLRPLQREHVRDYLARRGLPNVPDPLVDFALSVTKGEPLQLAKEFDAFLRMMREKEPEPSHA